MNSAALRKPEPIISIPSVMTEQSVGVPPTKEASAFLARVIMIVFGITLLALYSTGMKFRIDEKYSALEKVNSQRQETRYKIALLESEVESLKDYHRIEKVLVENNIETTSPQRAVHIALAGGNGEPVARTDRRGARPKGNI